MASQIENNLYNTNNLQVPTSQVVLIYTEWNEHIVNELVKGAKNVFKNFKQVTLTTYQVPGAVELTHALKACHEALNANAYIALGCVIRGETPHFDYVCNSVTQGITYLNSTISSPIIMGVLTVDTLEQAQERIGGKDGHKGEEAAMAALKMISLSHHLNQLKFN